MKKILPLLLCYLLSTFSVLAQTPISGVINVYAKVDSVNTCLNTVYAPAAAGFGVGDKVLLIQMKGADVNLTNTASFGNINAYNNAGNYELATISAISGSAITFVNTLQRTYTNGAALQLVRIPAYSNVDVIATLTAANWNGSTGGVLIFEAATVNLNANIDVSGKGFRGGDAGNFPASCPAGTGTSLYFSDTLSGKGGEKGEGIVILANGYLACRGKAANGGGGGNDHNGGAGGGGNGAAGGIGGENDEPFFSCPGSPGLAALGVDNTLVADKIFIGSGGGAGHGNNTNGTGGGDGGGIIIIIANQLIGNGYSMLSNGESVTALAWGDGAGGGGSGGSIVLDIPTVNNLSIQAKGGKGGDTGANQCTGPGGGGSGGVLKYSNAAIWPGVTVDVTGGIYGTNTTVTSPCFGNNNGATSGGNGLSVANWVLAQSVMAYNPNFALAGDDVLVCAGNSTTLNGSGGIGYVWSPTTYLDNPFIPNPICTPLSDIAYTLTVTNASGCSDTDVLTVSIAPAVTADAGDAVTICNGESITLNASGGIDYAWSPTFFLDDPSSPNPVATPTFDINYTVTVTDANGCIGTDMVAVTVGSTNFLSLSDDAAVCAGGSVNLYATGGSSYSWSPDTYLSDATVSNPVCTPLADITYLVTSISALGCEDVDSLTVSIVPADFVHAGDDIAICSGSSATLNATGGITFNWSPATYLDDASISNPICTPLTNITYIVTSATIDGCIDFDTIQVTVNPGDFLGVLPDVVTCVGEAVDLYATGGVTYAWSPATYLDDATVATPVCTPLGDITYIVTATNMEGCSDTKTVNVATLAAAPVVAGPDTTVCFGGQIKMYVTEGVAYLWTPSTYLDFTTISGPTSSPATSVSYVVYVTDINGCVASDTVDIIVNAPPVIIASDDVTICEGDVVSLSASGGVSYIWIPDPLVPCTGCETVEVSPSATTTYIVQGVDANGCFGTDQVTVNVELCNTINDFYAAQIKVYPNPAGQLVNIELPDRNAVNTISVWNILGEKIPAVVTSINNQHYQLQLNQLPAQQIVIQIDTPAATYFKTIVIK